MFMPSVNKDIDFYVRTFKPALRPRRSVLFVDYIFSGLKMQVSVTQSNHRWFSVVILQSQKKIVFDIKWRTVCCETPLLGFMFGVGFSSSVHDASVVLVQISSGEHFYIVGYYTTLKQTTISKIIFPT